MKNSIYFAPPPPRHPNDVPAPIPVIIRTCPEVANKAREQVQTDKMPTNRNENNRISVNKTTYFFLYTKFFLNINKTLNIIH